MTDQHQLAADILGQVVPVGGEPPAGFAEWVHEQIAARPSPVATVQPTLADIDRKLDEILTLLRGEHT